MFCRKETTSQPSIKVQRYDNSNSCRNIKVILVFYNSGWMGEWIIWLNTLGITNNLTVFVATMNTCLSYPSCWSSRSADFIPTFFSSSISSPFLCIWSNISHPPTNSPPINTCGIVGQFVKSLIPEMFAISSSNCFQLSEILRVKWLVTLTNFFIS